ncbi:unnamed protein product [Sphagnum troendelagicum]|uniref:Uncharacterized protein n=1 Tax=Sphagnum troendelagicum TaxID=128251 RepID=A0ABP0TT61_9BRYO
MLSNGDPTMSVVITTMSSNGDPALSVVVNTMSSNGDPILSVVIAKDVAVVIASDDSDGNMQAIVHQPLHPAHCAQGVDVH